MLDQGPVTRLDDDDRPLPGRETTFTPATEPA